MQLAFHTVHTPIQGKPEVVESYKQKIKDGMNHRNEQYAAMVHSLDENVGRILDAVDDLGVADNTVVIFTSDNGGFINDFEGKQVTDNSPLRSGRVPCMKEGFEFRRLFTGLVLRKRALSVQSRLAVWITTVRYSPLPDLRGQKL